MQFESRLGRPAGITILPRKTDACFIIDDEPGVCHFISLVLREFGLEASAFADAGPALAEVAARQPGLVFLDVSLDGSDAVDAIRGLEAQRFTGAVQLISGKHQGVLDRLVQIGERHGLRMLPAMRKPFDAAAVRAVVSGLLEIEPARQPILLPQKSALPAPARLDEALREGWVEFWYQPKVDLATRRICGVEALARLRHPALGVLLPSRFLPGADEQGLHDLATLALQCALRDGEELAEAGYELPFAVNVTAATLATPTLTSILRRHAHGGRDWRGLILEITEDQVANDLDAALEAAIQLRIGGVRLSIDDFGRGYSSLERLKSLPFAELKIDRSFVLDCATDVANAALCRSAIEIAHRFDCMACAEGIENQADLDTLLALGCDRGQGFFFAPALPKAQLLTALRHGFGHQPPVTPTAEPFRLIATA